MPNLTKAQIIQRMAAIMASDMPIIMGLSKFKSPLELALEKNGEVKPDFSPMLSRDIGHLVEPITKKLWEKETGMKAKLNKHSFFAGGDNCHHGATPDGFVIEDGEEKSLLELKYSTAGARWSSLPDEVYIQCMWQLHVLKKDVCHVAGLVAYKGTNLKIHEVQRDDRFIRELVMIANEFWDAIKSGHLPKPTGTDSESKALEKYYQKEKTTIAPFERHDPELIEILDGMEDLGEEIKALTKKKNQAKNSIKVYIGENTKMLSGNYKVSWKRPATKNVTDWKAVTDDILEDAADQEYYGDLLHSCQVAIEKHTEKKEGSRRMNIYKDKEDG